MAVSASQAVQQKETATASATLAAALPNGIAKCMPSLPHRLTAAVTLQKLAAALQQLLTLLVACVNLTAATAAGSTAAGTIAVKGSC